MRFRFTYTDEGDNVKTFDNPGGWSEASIGFHRDTKWWSLFEVFKSSFLAYGSNGSQDGGRDWFLQVEKTYGPDAELDVLVEIDPDDNDEFETFYEGQVPIGMVIETLNNQSGHLLQLDFTNSDFWTRFVNRYSSKVDIRSATDLDGNPVDPAPKFTLPLPSQVIIKKYKAEQKYNQCIDFSEGTYDGSVYSQNLQVDFDTVELEEISDTFHYGLNPLNPSNTGKILPFAKFIIKEDGDFTIDSFNITLSTQENVATNNFSSPMFGKENRTSSTIGFFKIIIQVNSVIKHTLYGVDRAVANYNRNDGKAIVLLNGTVTDYSFSGSLGTLNKNDQVRIYAELMTPVNFSINVSYGQPFDASYYRGLMVWGSQGWNKDTFCPYLGGENFQPIDPLTTILGPYIDARFTSLIEVAYDPYSDTRANPLTGFPTFRDTGFLNFININDSFIIGNDATVLGSGVFSQSYNKGDYLQVAFLDRGAGGTVACNTGSNKVIGTGTNFNITDHPMGSVIYVTGVFDNTCFIGQVVSVDSATQITLATNAGANFSGKEFGRIEFYVNSVSLYEGLEAFGDTHLEVTFNSVLPASETEAFLTHDIGSAITDRVVGESGKFYSEYLGNAYTSREYPETGCGSNIANTKGLHIRGYKLEGDPDPTKNKPFFSSMEDWIQGLQPIHPIGMGYELVDGEMKIRAEEIGHFMDGSEMSILLSNVFNIRRKYDDNHQFNSAKIGYEKWQSQAATGVGTPSGIDDPQSVRTWNSRFKKIGKPFTALSKWIAASLTIETTRRIGSQLSSNYTYDDETFVISLKNNGDGTFQPRLEADGFSLITNLSNASTRYNPDLTVARNFLRWLPYLSGALQNYLSSFWKFASGEGNYTMTSTMTTDCPGDEDGIEVAENGDFQVSTDTLFVPMPYEIEHYLTLTQYKAFKAKKNKTIGISQSESGHKKYVVINFEWFPGKNGLLKMIACPKTQDDVIDIEVIISDNSEELSTGARHYVDQYEQPYE